LLVEGLMSGANSGVAKLRSGRRGSGVDCHTNCVSKVSLSSTGQRITAAR
jgi:hypothetical protein